MEIIPVVMAVITKNNKILLGKRDAQKKFMPFSWAVPGGKVEPGEKIMSALRREIMEEIGIGVKNASLLRVSEQFHDEHHHIIFNFLVNKYDGIPVAGSDVVEVEWFSKEEIKNLNMREDDKKFIADIDLSGKNSVKADIY